MFQLRPEDRLRSWREFRSSIDLLSAEEALLRTADLWAHAPFVPYNLDPDTPETWPDPWTLLLENTYCDVAKCLGIVYTMSLTQHKISVEFRQYEDPKTRYVYNLAWFDQGKYILNMVDRETVNKKQFDETLKLKQKFTAVDLKLEYYNN
jgi:hypothetical protein